MILSIASGKGGTGKTTVATNLAFSLGSGTQLIDCDVEEPNAHLFMDPDIHTTKPVAVPVPRIKEELCDYCKLCSEICRFNAIAVFGNTVLTFPELCHGCGGCMAVCPRDAIVETQREMGRLEEGTAGNIGFSRGILNVGEAMAPPVIKAVKSLDRNHSITIIDAPPGTSCPVITAIKGTDFVLMVTEPTPFGLHDLKLAVGAVKLLNIPYGLVINRSDIGTTAVHEYAKKEGLPVLMEIPFDRGIAEAYSKGELIAKAMPGWKEKFRQLYGRIEVVLGQRSKEK